MEAWKASLTTRCTCEYYDLETDAYLGTSECYGDCFDMAHDDALTLFENWANHWETNGIRVEGSGMTWRGLSGYAEATFNDMSEALKLFTIESDYTLELALHEDGSLTARRYSHDEPMGCLLVAYAISEV